MSDLLSKYEEMQKVAEAEALENERVEAIVEYASLADELLSENFDESQYNEDDVIKVAEFLIANDLEAEEEEEKVAEYDQLGRILARSFADELSDDDDEDFDKVASLKSILEATKSIYRKAGSKAGAAIKGGKAGIEKELRVIEEASKKLYGKTKAGVKRHSTALAAGGAGAGAGTAGYFVGKNTK